MRIGILEDDVALCAHLEEVLREDGHNVVKSHSGKDFQRLLRRDSFDVLLLDWEVPDLSGMEVLCWARDNVTPLPGVIMITSRVGELDIVAGLRAGADDYITKPVQDIVLRARVDALLRRTYGAPPATATASVEVYGDYVFHVSGGAVTVDGYPVAMTSKEFALALLLFRNLDRPLSRNHIMEALWGREPDTLSRTLDVHISRVRILLHLRPERGLRLSSVYSFGYRLERLENFATGSGGP